MVLLIHGAAHPWSCSSMKLLTMILLTMVLLAMVLLTMVLLIHGAAHSPELKPLLTLVR